MVAILNSLAWKEFHELKWAVAASAVIALAIPLCYVPRDPAAALFAVHTALAVYPLLAGVVFGMRAAAGERSGRTAPFVAALPAPIQLLGAMSLLISLLAALVPLLLLWLAGLALSLFADAVYEAAAAPLANAVALSALATVCCLAVAAVGGLGQPTEMRAAAAGFAAIIVTWFVGQFALVTLLSRLQEMQYISAPGESERWYRILGLGEAALGAALFAGYFILRYARAVQPIAAHRHPWITIGGWIPAQLRSPIAALAWKGARESGVLGAQVLLAALLLSWFASPFMAMSDEPRGLLALMGRSLPFFLLLGGFLLAILVGVGAVVGDVQPAVNIFWRSRPISPAAWYWTKYALGVATLLVAIELPLLLLNRGPSDPSDFMDRGLFWLMLLWNATFSFALTATCLVRLPAHAAVLAIGTTGILYAALEATFGSFMPGEPGAPLAILVPAFLIAFALSTFAGWWAAVCDVSLT